MWWISLLIYSETHPKLVYPLKKIENQNTNIDYIPVLISTGFRIRQISSNFHIYIVKVIRSTCRQPVSGFLENVCPISAFVRYCGTTWHEQMDQSKSILIFTKQKHVLSHMEVIGINSKMIKVRTADIMWKDHLDQWQKFRSRMVRSLSVIQENKAYDPFTLNIHLAL